jgi:predicted enzyme related to lactoylglutathione lyase
MARATGVGGVFLRATDPARLHRWYADVLDLPVDGSDYGIMRSEGGETLTWALFPADTEYFGSKRQAAMINYRVDDLDGVLKRLREAGAAVDDHIEKHEYGRFGWAVDPEGNRFELWQPPPGH